VSGVSSSEEVVCRQALKDVSNEAATTIGVANLMNELFIGISG
jgi:hypothetical protein